MHIAEILSFAQRLHRTELRSSISATERSVLRKRNAERREAHKAMGLVK